jgi:RNA polymerase sigma factor (sigma-70 family)
MTSQDSVPALVTGAREGDGDAWDQIVERYAPLVWSICRRLRLGPADAEDVNQTVWLLLVEQLGNLREPAALPGWLATTTRREALRVLRAARTYESAGSDADIEAVADPSAEPVDHEIVAVERNAALCAAFAALPPRCQRLLSMLIADPPSSYAEISQSIPIPIGSIGPQRSRCLDRLRRSPVLTALFGDEVSDEAGAAAKNVEWGGEVRA